MKVTDFAEKQTHYTGANNKKKWVITNPDILYKYLEESEFKPSSLARKLQTSYSTVKRFLCSAGLWDKAIVIAQRGKSGRKRTAIIDKFGYKYADSKHDYKNERGEIVRRFEHIVVAEEKIGRPLKDREVVHHIDGNKTNNNPSNLHVCDDNSVHRLLHGSLEREAFKLVELGIIKFHPDHGYYHNKELAFDLEAK